MRLMKTTTPTANLLLLAVILFTCPVPATAESRTLRVAYTEWSPYTYTENGEPAGFEVEILRTVLAAMDIKPEFQPLPWKRCLLNLKTGHADMVVSMLHTQERALFALYPEEHISESITKFFVLKDSPIVFNGDYNGLRRYAIGVIRGFSYGRDFDDADYLLKDESTDPQTLIGKLIANRVDLAAENAFVAAAEANSMGVFEKIKFLSPPIHTQKLYVGFSRVNGLERLCRDFSRKLAEFKKTEDYRRILAAHHAAESEPGALLNNKGE